MIERGVNLVQYKQRSLSTPTVFYYLTVNEHFPQGVTDWAWVSDKSPSFVLLQQIPVSFLSFILLHVLIFATFLSFRFVSQFIFKNLFYWVLIGLGACNKQRPHTYTGMQGQQSYINSFTLRTAEYWLGLCVVCHRWSKWLGHCTSVLSGAALEEAVKDLKRTNWLALKESMLISWVTCLPCHMERKNDWQTLKQYIRCVCSCRQWQFADTILGLYYMSLTINQNESQHSKNARGNVSKCCFHSVFFAHPYISDIVFLQKYIKLD